MEVKERYAGLSFTDVLWRFLESWKIVIIFAVLGLLVSLLYVRKNYAGLQEDYRLKKQQSEKIWTEYRDLLIATADYNAIAEQVQNGTITAPTPDAAAAMRDRWSAALTQDQIDAVSNVISIKKQMSDLSKYMQNSILMNIDAYNIGTLYMVFELSNETGSYGNLIIAYTGYLKSIDCTKAIAEECGYADESFDETVYNELMTAAALNGSQFYVSYRYKDTETLEKVSASIRNLLAAKQPELNSQFGAHNLTCIESVTSYTVDTALGNTKNSYQQYITNYANQINNNKTTFTNNNPSQINLYNSLADIEDGGTGYVSAILPNEPKVDEPSLVRSKLVYYIVGICIGIILAAGFVYLRMLFSTRIQKTDELDRIYGLNVLGTIPGKRPVIIDRLIYKWKNRKTGYKDEAECIDMAAAAIAAACKAKDARSLVITGTAIKAAEEKQLEALSSKLKEAGISVTAHGNINCEKAVYDAVMKSDAVAVVEKTCRSVYREVDQEALKLKATGIPVIGAIGIQ